MTASKSTLALSLAISATGAQAFAAKRIYTVQDFERIQQFFKLSAQAKAKANAEPCVKPALAAWADKLAADAAKQGVDVPDVFPVLGVNYFPNMKTVWIGTKGGLSYTVVVDNSNRVCAATNTVYGPVRSSDVLR